MFLDALVSNGVPVIFNWQRHAPTPALIDAL